MAEVLSVNVGRSEPNPVKPDGISTGIGKRPVSGPFQVRAPGDKRTGLGSGVVGDHIGDQRHHGGDDQAIYAFAREDLDRWSERLGREIPNGLFGENLTTTGLDPNTAVLGEVWRIGEAVELTVTAPRVPCATFAARIGEPGWVKTFTADGRPGTYLRVTRPGPLRAGMRIEVVHRPEHGVTVGLVFRALTTERPLLAEVASAGDDLVDELRETVEGYVTG